LVDARSDLAASVLAAHHYEVLRPSGDDLVGDAIALEPDVVINDRLDTAAEDTSRLHDAGITVISFEDLGDGARDADLVINAIYPDAEPRPGHHIGPAYFLARPEFRAVDPRPIEEAVQRVLVTFGGVDASDLTARVIRSIRSAAAERGIVIDVVLGRGYANEPPSADPPDLIVDRAVSDMAERMGAADIVFTSAGRTIFEIACIGTPAIVLAQNRRELTHTFASDERGFRHLGLGSEVSDEAIRQAFIDLVDNVETRRMMQLRMLREDLRGGTARVVRLNEEAIEGV
jgi:spore coat polysaccharide biosynthesis predicted glycosyltransferase SpsG